MSTHDDVLRAHQRVQAMLHAGQAVEALKLAAELPSDDFNAIQILAIAEIEGGEIRDAPETIRQGVDRLLVLEQGLEISMAYNRANGHFAIWRIAAKSVGIAAAHAEHRRDLHAARDLFAEVAADEDIEDDLRCQALVNPGNSFDDNGRHADAIAAYRQALAICPRFGMALGNLGSALLHRASVEEVHQHALVSEAVAALDAAIAEYDDVIAHGGPSALEAFAAQREVIPDTPLHEHDATALPDVHLEWCRRQRLFLHPSQRCITPRTKALDRLPVSGMIIGIDDQAQQDHKALQDSLNSLLQDFLAVRYLAWTVLEPDTPLRRHAAELSAHASFSDSLTYARWGIATGLRVNAVAASTNLLDKIAGVAHQYLHTGQNPAQSYFRRFGLLPLKKKWPDQVHPKIGEELDAGNRGLLALCDLAGELERPTPLNDVLSRRHAATHRTVAVHDMLLDPEAASPWLDRVGVSELAEALLDQLGRARDALVYLADAINDRERRTRPDGPLPILPTWPAPPEQPEDW